MSGRILCSDLVQNWDSDKQEFAIECKSSFRGANELTHGRIRMIFPTVSRLDLCRFFRIQELSKVDSEDQKSSLIWVSHVVV